MHQKWIYHQQEEIPHRYKQNLWRIQPGEKIKQNITIKADQKRIDTILNMEPPTTKTQVQSFLGMVKLLHKQNT